MGKFKWSVALLVLLQVGGSGSAAFAETSVEKVVETKKAEMNERLTEFEDRKKELKNLFNAFKEKVGKENDGHYWGNRIYSLGGFGDTFDALKCSEYDYRVFRLCPKAEFFQASARVYFDNGKDEEGEVDLFKNGNVEPNLQLAAIRLPWRFGRSDAFDAWSWGPEFSAGLGAPASAGEGEEKKSTAPIVLISAGLRLSYKLTDEGSNFSFEVGRAFGFSADETFGDNDDSATYVGIKINIFPKKDP